MAAAQLLRLMLAVATALAAAGATPEVPRVLGLSHVAVKATDYEGSVAFYRDFLGFAEQGRLNYPNTGLRELTYLKVNDTQTIEVFDAANVTQVAGRLYQIALVVEDAEAMRSHLARHGFRVPPAVPRGQMRNANFTVRDPNGYIIELVQYLPEGRMIQDRGRFLSEARVSDHLVAAGVATSRAAETVRFYRDILGFSELTHADPVGGAVTPPRLTVGPARDHVEVVDAGGAHPPFFRFAVPSLELAKAQLERTAYFRTYGRPILIEQNPGSPRLIALWDPEGIRVELAESINTQRNDARR